MLILGIDVVDLDEPPRDCGIDHVTDRAITDENLRRDPVRDPARKPADQERDPARSHVRNPMRRRPNPHVTGRVRGLRRSHVVADQRRRLVIGQGRDHVTGREKGRRKNRLRKPKTRLKRSLRRTRISLIMI